MTETRYERAGKLLNETSAVLTNGLEIPKYTPKYVVLEMQDSDVIWAMFEDTLFAVAKSINMSETDSITGVRVYNLDGPVDDSASFRVPVMEVARFIICNG